jgi:hypothetical protein
VNHASDLREFPVEQGMRIEVARRPQLAIQQSNATLTVSWNRGGFTLQQANSPAGPWADVPGPIWRCRG